MTLRMRIDIQALAAGRSFRGAGASPDSAFREVPELTSRDSSSLQ